MVEVGAPDECIEEMRSFLHLEGWNQHQHLLPSGWMLRIDEDRTAVKCSLMRNDGELFEDWAEGLKYLERLGKDTKKLKEMVDSPTFGREILVPGEKDNGTRAGDSDYFLDFKAKLGDTIDDDVKVVAETEADCTKANGSPNKMDHAKNEEMSKVDTNVDQLPKGWRTRNTLGDKGFRIYSPPGLNFFERR